LKEEIKDCKCCPAKIDCSTDDCKGKDSKCTTDKLQQCKCEDGKKDTTPVIIDPTSPPPDQSAIDDLAWDIFQNLFNGNETSLSPETTDPIFFLPLPRLSCADPSISKAFNRDDLDVAWMLEMVCKDLISQKMKIFWPATTASNGSSWEKGIGIEPDHQYAQILVQLNATAESCDSNYKANDPIGLDFSTISVDECVKNWVPAMYSCLRSGNAVVQDGYYSQGGTARSKCISWSILGVRTKVN
jgi:hypothetical protein